MQFNVFHARRILSDNRIRPIKRKGQHFITDRNITEKQVDYADLRSSDLVLEIGGGLGGLTETIAIRRNNLVTIEIDRRLIRLLKVRFGEERNVSLIMADALSFNLNKIDKIISNIPYNLSSQITFKILESNFEIAILTYQLEFAKRMIAQPGSRDYGRLSVNVGYRAEVEILDTIPKGAFYPVPLVDSAIIKLRRKEPPFHLENEEFFFKTVQGLFSYRNQFLRKVIKRFLRVNGLENLDGVKIIRDAEVKDERIRNISPESIAKLSNEIYSLVSHND